MAKSSKQAEPEEKVKKERPKTQNQSSDEVRWIDISIDVRKIEKKWIFAGEKGDYLHLSMRMQPDGEVDAYGNLGMITQKVPKEIYEKEVKLPKEKKTKGPILGNACEFVKAGHEEREGDPGAEVGKLGGVVADDLPF